MEVSMETLAGIVCGVVGILVGVAFVYISRRFKTRRLLVQKEPSRVTSHDGAVSSSAHQYCHKTDDVPLQCFPGNQDHYNDVVITSESAITNNSNRNDVRCKKHHTSFDNNKVTNKITNKRFEIHVNRKENKQNRDEPSMDYSFASNYDLPPEDYDESRLSSEVYDKNRLPPADYDKHRVPPNDYDDCLAPAKDYDNYQVPPIDYDKCRESPEDYEPSIESSYDYSFVPGTTPPTDYDTILYDHTLNMSRTPPADYVLNDDAIEFY